MTKEKKFLRYKGKKIYYYLKRKKKIFLFIHGIGGCLEHFYNAKNYAKNDNGILLVDLPGFGSSFRKGAAPKNIAEYHAKALLFILKNLKIAKLNIVFFSLSTCYLKFFISSEKWKDVEKIFFIEPSIMKGDLDWSLKIYHKGKTEYKNYVKKLKANYKKLFYITFPTINFKKKNTLIKNIENMNYDYLYKLVKSSVNAILKNKLFFLIKNMKKKIFFIYSKKNSQYKIKINKKKNKFYLIDSKYHHIMLDKPKEVYSKILT